jgi:hypothetical protein
MSFFINDLRLFYLKEFEYKIFLSFNIIKYRNYFLVFLSLLGYSAKFLVVDGIRRNVTALNNKARDENGRNNESVGARESQEFLIASIVCRFYF